MPDKKKLKEAINNRAQIRNDIPDEFMKHMADTQQKFYRRLQNAIKEFDVTKARIDANGFNLKLLAKLRNNLNEWLRDVGYYANITEFGKGYNDLLIAQRAYWGSMDLDPVFTERDLDTLSQIKKDDLNFLRNRNQDVINTTYKEVLSGIYERRDWRDLQDKLKLLQIGDAETRGLIQKYCGTYANTAFAAFDRQALKIKADQFDLEYYYFTGIRLRSSRDWCSEKVNRVFTKKQVDQWEDDTWRGKKTGGSVWVYLGGYNCTHTLDPVSEEMAKELGYK